MSAALAAACLDCATLLGRPDTLLGYSLWQLMQRGPEEQLHRTEHAQPALLAAAVADALHWLAGGETPSRSWGTASGSTPRSWSRDRSSSVTRSGSLSCGRTSRRP